MSYIFSFLIAFILSIAISPLTVAISKRFNIYSQPNPRQTLGKPCLGGIAIFAAFIVSMPLFAYFFNVRFDYKIKGLLIASFLMFLLGVVDDAKNLRPHWKLITQLIAAALLIIFGIFTRISFLPNWVNVILTFIWIIFITNAFNLLDIVDGLTSGLVIVISSTLLVVSLLNGDIFSGIILCALIGSHCGFLRYNYPPAEIYMGDTGSLFSGFVLAAVAVNISYAPPEKPFALIAPVLVMSLPLYDTIFLIIMRLKKRKTIFSKTNDHFALRLLTMGYSARKGIWIMYLFSIFLAVSSLVIVFFPVRLGIAAFLTVIFVFIFAGKKVGLVKTED